MLTAIGRAAARLALLPNKTAALSLRLAARLPRELADQQVNALSLVPAVSARGLMVSARLLSPAKAAPSTGGTTKAKKAPAAGAAKKKKTTTAATKKKSAAAKKKPAAKKKKPAAKPKKKPAAKKKKKPAAKPKKKLTAEEKEKAGLKQLKKLALLKRPTRLPDSAWSVYVADHINKGEGSVVDQMKKVQPDFAKLSESEKERLESIASSNRAVNEEARKKWISEFSPEAIYTANIMRRRLARKLGKSRYLRLQDDRQPSRGRAPYTLFLQARYQQIMEGNVGLDPKEAFRAVAKEWKTTPESEKQPFKDESAKELETSRLQFQELRKKAQTYVKDQEGLTSAAVQIRVKE
ncbi:hypothetical protein E4U41_002958 [Claviceps citrina]|nr:hypothetical protein E4U41_002958 [Claviceps citrina]